MTDNFDDKKNMDEMSFEALFESYDEKMNRDLKQGDMVEGRIISVGKTQVYVDTGTKSDGVVEKQELLDETGQFPYQAGDVLKLYVVSLSESEIILSRAISGAGKTAMIQEAYQAGTPVEGRVTEAVKGGFSVDLLGKRAFCPVSQMDVRYVENNEDYLGQIFHFLITRYEEKGKNIVVSRKELLLEKIREDQEAFLAKVSQGDTVQGKVTRLMPYGAFIELVPGVEGMAHISELSWSRVEKPEEVLQPGDTVMVKLLKIETREKGGVKISLSVKQTTGNPWDTMEDSFKVGDQVSGRVVRLAPFGAFVEIAPGVDGLVHISEMSHTRRVLKPSDAVEEGQTVQVVIKTIDMDTKRVSLSIKDALGDPWTGVGSKYAPGTILEGRVEKREPFGLFVSLEPGITGLMPLSGIRNSSSAQEYEKLKPGDPVQILVQEVDEEKHRITLVPPDQKDPDNWKQFVKTEKTRPVGTMESVLLEALKKKS